MDFIGVIKSASDPPGINQARWIALIQDHPNLIRPEPIDGINPFTREPMKFYASASTATAIVGGRDVGMMEWCHSDANEINVWGDPSIMVSLADTIALLLNGVFEKDEA